MSKDVRVTVIGAGSWGTALAVLLSKTMCCVRLWGHNSDHVCEISKQRENSKYLPSVLLPDNIEIIDNIEESVKGSKIIVMVVPSHGLRTVFVLLFLFLKVM